MKKYLNVSIFVIILIVSFLMITNNVFGYSASDISGFTDKTRTGAGLSNIEYTKITASVINVMLSVVGALFIILIISSGFTWMISQGNQEKIDKAKKTLAYAVVGLIIIIASYSIASVITTAIEEAPTAPLAGGPGGGGDGGSSGVATCSGTGYQCLPFAYECESDGNQQRFIDTGLSSDCQSKCGESTPYDGSCAGRSKSECTGSCSWEDAGLLAGGSCDWKCNFMVCCKSISNPCQSLGYGDCHDNDNCLWVPSATGVGGECLMTSPGENI